MEQQRKNSHKRGEAGLSFAQAEPEESQDVHINALTGQLETIGLD